MTDIGRIFLVDNEIEPYRLLDYDGALLFEIVDGQYRVEKLQGEADVKAPGEK